MTEAEARGSDSLSGSVTPSCEITVGMLQKNLLINFGAQREYLETKRGDRYTLPRFCDTTFLKRRPTEKKEFPILDATFHLSKWLLRGYKFGHSVSLPEIVPQNRYKEDNSIQEDFCYLLDTLSFPPINKHLANFGWSTNFKSGITILYKGEFPVIVIEINSSPMMDTIAKLAANLIDFLRYMRHFDVDSVNQLIGFAFPKLKVKGYVAEVTVTWKELRFHVSVVRYGLDQRGAVDLMLKNVFESQLKIAMKLHTHVKKKISHYFIPFSASDLALVEKGIALSSSSLQQVNSRFSLVFTNGEFYFKCCPAPEQQLQIQSLSAKTRSITSNLLLVPAVDMVYVLNMSMLKFRKQEFSLSLLDMDQRISCLCEIACGVKAALEQLHGLGFAHLDVRIHNVCYHQGNVTLIDFDRARPAADKGLPHYKGYMYTASPGSTCGDLDWKQLGLLIHSIQKRLSNNTKLNEASVKNGTSLVQSLVFKYTWLVENDLNDMKYTKYLKDAMKETIKKDGSGATEEHNEESGRNRSRQKIRWK